MSKYIRRIVIALLSLVCFVACKEREGGEMSETRKLLNDVKVVIKEKPDSAFRVLKALEIPEDEETMAEYSI